MDTPGQQPPRFPADLEAAATARIGQTLASLGVGSQDMALTQGACGADLLWAEACVSLQVCLQLMQPLTEEAFIAASIRSCANGAQWHRRYEAVKSTQGRPPQCLPPGRGDVFRRCNEWLLATALASRAEDVLLLCLWDGVSDRRAGGTAHLVRIAQGAGVRVVRIDTRTLH